MSRKTQTPKNAANGAIRIAAQFSQLDDLHKLAAFILLAKIVATQKHELGTELWAAQFARLLSVELRINLSPVEAQSLVEQASADVAATLDELTRWLKWSLFIAERLFDACSIPPLMESEIMYKAGDKVVLCQVTPELTQDGLKVGQRGTVHTIDGKLGVEFEGLHVVKMNVRAADESIIPLLDLCLPVSLEYVVQALKGKSEAEIRAGLGSGNLIRVGLVANEVGFKSEGLIYIVQPVNYTLTEADRREIEKRINL